MSELLPYGVEAFEESASELEPEEAEARLGGSVSCYDARYSQSRESVTHLTPARAAIVAEGEELKERMEKAADRLKALREGGASDEAMSRAEASLDAAIEIWMDWQNWSEQQKDDEREPGADVGAAADLDGYISLKSLLTRDLDTGRELDGVEIEARLAALRALMLYVTQDGVANPWLSFKNFLAVTRRVRPQMLDAISKADLAILLGETRAATCDREIRIFERYLRAWGVKGFQGLGGNKSMSTRRRCSEAQKGNTSRRDGAKRRYKP